MIDVQEITGNMLLLKEAFKIRQAAFVLEQKVDPHADFDGRDEDSRHFLATSEGKPAGTARIRLLEDGIVKLERMAVLKEYRGRSVGSALLRFILGRAEKAGARVVVLNAQATAKDFYEKHGFVVEGDPFYEQNILHYAMRRSLPEKDPSILTITPRQAETV